MKRNEYEFLINNIYCGNALNHVAINPDTYERMQSEYNNLIKSKPVKGELYSEYTFKKSFLVVCNYVQQAIKDGMRSLQYTMRASDVNKLTYMVATLNRHFFDKRSLDQIISTANNVFNQYKLN